MLTQFFRSINWVDVALVLLAGRIIFCSVKTGFITELFKLLGVFCALFVSLHYYAVWAALAVKKTTLPVSSLECVFFVGIWALIALGVKLLRDGILLLFKVEATHQGFDKYGAGFLGASRAIFTASLVIFALLLTRHEYVGKQVLSSWSYKIAGKVAPNTYKSLYDQLIGKLVAGEKFNADVFAVVGGHGVNPK